MNKTTLTYISKSLLGSIIPATYMFVFVYYLYKTNAFVGVPIQGVVYIIRTFGEYGNYTFWIFYLLLPLGLIFLNGIFCAYKKIDWKVSIIITMLIFNFLSYATVGITQPICTVIYIITHVLGYFIGTRILNNKYSKQGI